MLNEKQTQAADQLEELRGPVAEIVRLLRQGQSPGKAYALLYELRWRIGRITNPFGYGVPSKADRDFAKEVIDSQIWEDTSRG